MREPKTAKHPAMPQAGAAPRPAAEAARYPVAFPSGPWQAQIALRIRRQVLDGRASPDVLPTTGWPVRTRD